MKVRFETTKGAFALALEPDKAPETVENFLGYVRAGFYDGTVFHRVIDGFVVQGGGFEPGLAQKTPGTPIANEADNGLSNEEGAIAMARTSDPHSAASQFFINLNDNDFLDHFAPTEQGWGYCVFGRVVEGMDTIHAIKSVETGTRGGMPDVPLEDVVVERATVLED